MRVGTQIVVAVVIAIFGAAKPHRAYLFANRRATRMNVWVYHRWGISLAMTARGLNRGQSHCFNGDHSTFGLSPPVAWFGKIFTMTRFPILRSLLLNNCARWRRG